MSPFRKALLSIAVLAPLCSFGLQRTALLPPEGQAYIRISDTVDFWKQLQKSSVGKLWMDQQFQDFMGSPDLENWQSLFFGGDSKEEDAVFTEQMKMLTGEVVFAVDMQTDNIYIIADMSADDFERSLELDDNLRGVMDSPFEIVKDSFQDVEIIQHIDGAGTAEEVTSWQAHVGRTLVLGYDREWIEKCIIMLKNNAIDEPAGVPVCSLNLPIRELIADSLSDTPSDQEARRMFEAMGLLSINTFTARIELREDEMVIDNNLLIDDLDRGLFSMLDTEPSELPTVEFIPENISSLEVGRIDLQGLWQEIPVMLSEIDPASKQQFDMYMALIQQQTGIDLEQDLLAHLGTKYLSFSTVVGDTQTSIIALELEDGMAFRHGLESALSAPSMQAYAAAMLDQSDFLNYTIYTPKNAPAEETAGVAVTDDYLLYGDLEGLRQTIRGIASSGAANTAFEQTELVQGLRRIVSPRAFGFGAVDWKKNMNAILAELAKPEYVRMITHKWAESDSPLPPPDFSKLPAADHIAQFFNTSYQYVEADDNGLHQKIILKY